MLIIIMIMIIIKKTTVALFFLGLDSIAIPDIQLDVGKIFFSQILLNFSTFIPKIGIKSQTV